MVADSYSVLTAGTQEFEHKRRRITNESKKNFSNGNRYGNDCWSDSCANTGC